MKRKIFLISMCALLVLGMCGCNKEEEYDGPLGEISEEVLEETSEVPSTEPAPPVDEFEVVTPEGEKIMDTYDDGIVVTTSYVGKCYYDIGFNFGEKYKTGDELQELSIIATLPKELSNTARIMVCDSVGNPVKGKPIIFDGFYADGNNGHYMIIHIVADKNINLADYKLKFTNGWSTNDFFVKSINLTQGAIPEDLKGKLIDIEGKHFYYTRRNAVSSIVDGENYIDEYYSVFTPVDCSLKDFPLENMTFKLKDNLDENLNRIMKCELVGRLETYVAASSSEYGCSAISPALHLRITYNYKELRQYFGNFWAQKLGLVGDNLEFYYNGNKICNL